jgi:hypothetical protein
MTDSLPAEYDDPSFIKLSANICAELACGLADAKGIKKRYGISDEQWLKLKKSKFFRGMLAEAIEKFRGDMNAGRRITVKSEVLLEDMLPLLHDWAHDPQIAISNRLDVIKTAAELAGRKGANAANQASGGPAGGGFNVNIVIRGNERREVIDVTSTPALEVTGAEPED